MRVTVDPDSARRRVLRIDAADIFELGDEDVVQIADGPVPPDREIDVRAAVEQCPKAALRLID